MLSRQHPSKAPGPPVSYHPERAEACQNWAYCCLVHGSKRLAFFQGYLEQDLWLATPPVLRTLSALSVNFQVIKAAVSVAGLLWPARATPKRYNSSVCLCTSHCYQLMSLNERQTPLNLKINMVGPQLINIALTNPHQAPKGNRIINVECNRVPLAPIMNAI
jgi:hypothetical protein